MNTTPIPGDTVITFYDSTPVTYGGDSDYAGGSTLKFGLFDGKLPVRNCPVDKVAPADTVLPVKDSRVVIVKLAKKPLAWVEGPWTLALPGVEHVTYYKTKRDATAAGLRRLAIIDHVAARAVEVQA